MKVQSFIKSCRTRCFGIARLLYRACKYIKFTTNMIFFRKNMNLFCPCCGLRFHKFTAGNYLTFTDKVDIKRYENTEQDVLCPFCRSLPRHRILASWCGRHINRLRSSRILYFAPESSMMLWMKRHKISCTTADLYMDADLRLDIQETGLPDSSYEAVICNHVLEHVDDFRKALQEIHRILCKGGFLICSFPIDETINLVEEDSRVKTREESIRRFGQFDHKRIFGMNADLLLEEAGFKVKRINGEDYPEEILPVVGPANYDKNILYYCVKE